MSKDRTAQLQQAFEEEAFSRTLETRLISIGDGLKTIVEMPVQQWQIVSENQIVQGGITAALADWAGVFAAMNSVENGHTYLASLHMEYIKPIKSYEILRAVAEICEARGNRIWINVKVSSTNPKAELKALGQLTFIKPQTP